MGHGSHDDDCQEYSVTIARLGGKVVGFGFLAELAFLEGRKVLSQYEVNALLRYE